MAEQGPKGWIGRRAEVFVVNAGVPDVGSHLSDVLAVDELGTTMSGIPATRVDFFPWSAVRQVSLLQDRNARQDASQQQQNPYDMEPSFPRVNF